MQENWVWSLGWENPLSCGSGGKESANNVKDLGSIPMSGRYPYFDIVSTKANIIFYEFFYVSLNISATYNEWKRQPYAIWIGDSESTVW